MANVDMSRRGEISKIVEEEMQTAIDLKDATKNLHSRLGHLLTSENDPIFYSFDGEELLDIASVIWVNIMTTCWNNYSFPVKERPAMYVREVLPDDWEWEFVYSDN